MYINFWYPVARSEDVTADAPFRTEIMGLRFVAWRDKEGKPQVLSDTCVHRGGSLGKGKIKNGNVQCPYHGWQFSGDGVCRLIPSIGADGKPPARANVDAYPAEERYVIVFAFLGDLDESERPPLYEIEEWGQEGWRANELIVFDVDYHFERSIENGLDPAHNEFVHPTHGFSGENPDYRVRDFDVEDRPLGCWFQLVMDSSGYKDDTMSRIRKEAGQSVAGTGTYGPNMMYTLLHLTETTWFHQYVWEAPVSDTKTRIFFINMRNCMLDPALDAKISERNMEVAHQDIAVLTEVDPVRTPRSNAKEVLMPADKPILRYRELLKGWENKGWKIDFAELNRRKGGEAFAIPSPERRTSGNWVLETVPFVQPSAMTEREAAE